MPRLGPKRISQARVWFHRHVYQDKSLLARLVELDYSRHWLDLIKMRWYPCWARNRGVDRDAFRLYLSRFARTMVDEFTIEEVTFLNTLNICLYNIFFEKIITYS
jgi:hypothetical protein